MSNFPEEQLNSPVGCLPAQPAQDIKGWSMDDFRQAWIKVTSLVTLNTPTGISLLLYCILLYTSNQSRTSLPPKDHTGEYHCTKFRIISCCLETTKFDLLNSTKKSQLVILIQFELSSPYPPEACLDLVCLLQERL